MGKKRGEYKKYLYDSNMVMPKSTHYKKIKTCHQIPSNNENDDEQQSTSEITINVNNDINFDAAEIVSWSETSRHVQTSLTEIGIQEMREI